MSLVAALRSGFGLDVSDLAPVRGGADLDATVWRATTPTGRYAVKCRRNASTTGLRVAERVAAAVPAVPAPLRAVDGALTVALDGRQVSVVPWVDGPRAIEHPPGARHWAAYGETLAAVHGLDPPAGLPSYAGGGREALLSFAPRVPALAALWSGGWPRRLADRMGGSEDGGGPAVLCHGDPHLGNLLLAGDGVALVDWDDALLAPREWDLVFVLVGVLADRPVTEEQRAWFRSGYGPVAVDDGLVARCAAVRAAEDVVGWSTTVDDETATPQDRADALEVVRGILGPTGLVTLALR